MIEQLLIIPSTSHLILVHGVMRRILYAGRYCSCFTGYYWWI